MTAPNEIWLVVNHLGEICRGLGDSGCFMSAGEAQDFADEQRDPEDEQEGVSYTVCRYIRLGNTPSQLHKHPRGQLGQ